MFPTPNKVDFDYVFHADVGDNPLVLIVVTTVLGMYLILLVYARRRDCKDSEKVSYYSFESLTFFSNILVAVRKSFSFCFFIAQDTLFKLPA